MPAAPRVVPKSMCMMSAERPGLRREIEEKLCFSLKILFYLREREREKKMDNLIPDTW